MYFNLEYPTLIALRFRWVECQLMALRRRRDIEDLETALTELPETLDAMYDRMFQNIRGEKDRKRAKCALQLVVVAYRPLTLNEINEALTIDCEGEIINRKRRMRDPFGILEICSGLIERYTYAFQVFAIDEYREADEIASGEERLRFAHFSVKEFLVSSRILHSSRPSSFFAISESDVHCFATTACLIYLISAIETEIPTAKQFPFIQYAAEDWYRHLIVTTFEIREILEYNLAIKLFDFPTNTRNRRWLSLHNPDRRRSNNTFGEPLYYSSLLGIVKATAFLLEKGADINAQSGD
jgi:ankyrin repeat domain-containing protein 50